MKEKKAATNLQLTIIVTGILAAIIAFIVISGVADPILNRLLGVVPEFNNTKPPAVPPGPVRYNIQLDKAQYYDGLKWVAFPKDWDEDIDFGGAITDHNRIRYDFEQYYYNTETRGGLPAQFQFKERRDVPGEGIFVEKNGIGMEIVRFEKVEPDENSLLDETLRGSVVVKALLDTEPNNPHNLLQTKHYLIDAKDKFYKQNTGLTPQTDAEALMKSIRGELNIGGLKVSLVHEKAFYPTRNEIYFEDLLNPYRLEGYDAETAQHLENLHGGKVDPKFKNLDVDDLILNKKLKPALEEAGVFWELRMTGKDGTTYYFKQIGFWDEEDNTFTRDKEGVAVYQASLGGQDGGLKPLNIHAAISGHEGWAITGWIHPRGDISQAYFIQTEEGERTWTEWWEGKDVPQIPVEASPKAGGEQEIYQTAINWRNSIFNSPMKVNLYNAFDNPSEGTTCSLYNVQKIVADESPYLLINIRQPIDRC